MLKKFFLNTLSSFVGAWIAIAVCGLGLIIFFFGAITKMALSSDKTEQITKKSIMVVDLTGEIEEVETARKLDLSMLMNAKVEKPQTLQSLVNAIEEAEENSDINGIYLKCNGASASPATFHALRQSLIKFKKSGKPIYAYADSYAQGDYYLASVADSIFLNPQGQLDLHGLNGNSLFFKGLFDKIGVTFQVFKVGTYKSAVEPYISETMSEPARAQLDTLYTNIWGLMRKEIADSRGINAQLIDTLINKEHITFRRPQFAQKSGLIDRLVYERQMDDIIGKIVDKDGEDVNYVSTELMLSNVDFSKMRSNKNQVAVLYATGEISESTTSGINCNILVPEIIELADNDHIKALVLRVNSPGGSAFGSEQIWEALEYFKSKNKPYVVSMGDYAASGGYWISSGADYIFADPMTITGSIGIFGLIPEFSGLMNKIGVNVVTTGTNTEAIFPQLFAPMNEGQRAAIQTWIEQGYDQFIERVSKGRNIPEQKVRQIAEGRVWDAVSAKKIGLVNELGSLQDAVEFAAKKAGVADKYDVGIYPVLESGIWDFIPQAEVVTLASRLHAAYPEVDSEFLIQMAQILTRHPVQARMMEMKIVM